MSVTNGQQYGREYSRPNSSLPTILACRICDKVFLSTLSLIIHYETHDELAKHRQSQRDRRNTSLGNSSFQQRYHPYLPNGHQERNVTAQNKQLYQTRNQPVSSWCPVLTIGGTYASAIGASQFTRNQPTRASRLHLGPTMNQHAALRSSLSNKKPGTSSKLSKWKGYGECGDKRTVWYLGQLERPIPSTIYLESQDESIENFNLNLRR